MKLCTEERNYLVLLHVVFSYDRRTAGDPTLRVGGYGQSVRNFCVRGGDYARVHLDLRLRRMQLLFRTGAAGVFAGLAQWSVSFAHA